MPCLLNKYIEDFFKGFFLRNKIYLQNTNKCFILNYHL